MDEQRLNEIRERAEKATPGPWKVESPYSGADWFIGSLITGNDLDDGKDYSVSITTDHLHGSEYATGTARTDAEFIAASRQDVVDLLDYVAELREQIAKLHSQVYFDPPGWAGSPAAQCGKTDGGE